MDFANYRQVDGIQMPFQVKISTTEDTHTETFSHVALNTPIANSKFNMPQGPVSPDQP
jgi:hypothetical protein